MPDVEVLYVPTSEPDADSKAVDLREEASEIADKGEKG